MALEEIKKRISTQNIVEEMFSRFTARFVVPMKSIELFIYQRIDILKFGNLKASTSLKILTS